MDSWDIRYTESAIDLKIEFTTRNFDTDANNTVILLDFINEVAKRNTIHVILFTGQFTSLVLVVGEV